MGIGSAGHVGRGQPRLRTGEPGVSESEFESETRRPSMVFRDDLPSLYAYNRWADGKMFDEVRKLSPEQYAAEPAPGWASVRSTLIHMGAVLKIWANRLGADVPPLTAPPTEADVPTV